MHAHTRPGLALAALILAASLGAALPSLPTLEPPKLWSVDLEPGEAAGAAATPAGEAFVAGLVAGSTALWKLDALGEPVWARRVAGLPAAVAALPDGSALVTGLYWGLGPDIVTTAFGSEGDVLWTRTIATTADELPRAVAASPLAVYVAGSTGRDGLLARYDLDGTHRWSKRITTAGEDRAEAVAVLPDGSPIVAGWTYDGVRNRVLLAKLDEYGNLQWQRALTWPGGSVRAYAASLSPAGDVLLAGLHSRGAQQYPFAARFDPRGELLWLRAIEAEPGAAAWGVAADAAGGAVVAGTAPNHLVPWERDWFLTRLTPQGQVAWSKRFDTGGDDDARGVALAGGVVTVGGTGSGWLAAARYLDTPVRP